MELFDVARIIGAVVKWLIYTGLLFGMIKIQKLNYNPLGLLGSSLLAILTSMIPVAGPYLAYVVLIVCLWKCTGAELFPDVTFTVAIAGALMFCINLWVLGALMGRLRPDLADRGRSAAEASAREEEAGDGDAEDQADAPKPPGLARTVLARTSAAATNRAASSAVTNCSFTVKGSSLGGTRPSVLISDGSQVYTVSRGESFTASLAQGRTRFRCDLITRTNVVLRSSAGQTVQLQLP